MPPQQTQPNNPPFQPPQGSPPGANPLPQGKNPMIDKANQAKASMGFATNLMTQMLQHQAPQPSSDSAQPSDKKNTDEKPPEEKEPDMNATLTDFKKEIEGMLDSKLGDIQRELQTLLSEEKDENNEEETKDTTIA